MQLAVPASMAIEFPATVGPVDRAIIDGSFLLVGWAIEETTGAAAAACYLRDGATARGGPMRVPIRLAANESTRDTVTGLGIVFERSLVLNVAAGSVAGVVFVVPTEKFRTEAGLVIVGESRPGYMEPLTLTEGA